MSSNCELLRRRNAPMPADRLANLPWLIVGDELVSPFVARQAGMSLTESSAVDAVQQRLASDRRANLLPRCPSFWFHPVDGRTMPLTPDAAWLRQRLARYAHARLAA